MSENVHKILAKERKILAKEHKTGNWHLCFVNWFPPVLRLKKTQFMQKTANITFHFWQIIWIFNLFQLYNFYFYFLNNSINLLKNCMIIQHNIIKSCSFRHQKEKTGSFIWVESQWWQFKSYKLLLSSFIWVSMKRIFLIYN